MAFVEDAWTQAQRRRWLRPDAERYIRPDAARFMRPDAERYYQPDAWRAYAPYLLEQKDHWLTQLRVPAGNADGGQWTSDSAIIADQDRVPRQTNYGDTTDFSAAQRGRGHHYVPRQLFTDEKLSSEARKVFEGESTGSLRDKAATDLITLTAIITRR